MANLLQQKVTVEFELARVNIDEIVKIIEKAGFQVPLEKKSLLVEGMT